MAIDPKLHGLVSDQMYVMFQALLEGKSHPLFETSSKMAKEYINEHQAEMITRGQDSMQAHKRAG